MMTEQYVGRVLDRRYQILEFIASGGMAQVFRAVHVGTGRPLAVKILKPKARDNPDNIRRFQREARLTATLEHENIIDVIDVQTDEEVYLVMELLAGVDLRVYLRRAGRLAWAEVRAIMLQICDAMQFAHDRGVVHRDLKPANCFRVEPGGRIKVLDLGIARPIASLPGDPSRITITGMLAGTPAYMAPEQLFGQANVRTDIYSAGVLMFELLTGRRPFVGQESELLRQIVNTPMPALTSVADDLDCPPATGAVIEGALAKLPEQRYASMRAFAGAIMALDAEPAAVSIMSEIRPTVGPIALSSAIASDDSMDPTTMAIVRMAARAEPLDAPPHPSHLAASTLPEPLPPPLDSPQITASPLPEPLKAPPESPHVATSLLPEPQELLSAPPQLAASSRSQPLEVPPDPKVTVASVHEPLAPLPVDAPPETARLAELDVLPRTAVTRLAIANRRWLVGVALATCLAAAGLVLWRAREPEAVGFQDRVDQPPAVVTRPTMLLDVPPGNAETALTTGVPQSTAGEPTDEPAPLPDATLPAVTSSSASATDSNETSSPQADPSSHRVDANATSPAPDGSPQDVAPDRPVPPTAKDAARAAAIARQKRQRSAERSVRGVLDQAGVGALVSRVKVTVQWSATGEVTEAMVHSLALGADRTSVEGRLRKLQAPSGAGPIRVEKTFELQLPE